MPYEAQLIHPCTAKHIQKYRKQQWIRLRESANEYLQNSASLLEKELKHLGWVENIIQGKSEADRVLYKCQQFVILPDFKFT